MSIYSYNEFIKEVRKNPENFYIIHYSCQSLYDDDNNENLSPRITSIAISHYVTDQTVSFSIHSIAEELKIHRENVQIKLDSIEKELLQRFYTFSCERRDKYWINWNMRNIIYGFEHLEHRYRVLGENNIHIIPIERRLNLNDLLSNRYGDNYIKDPKLKSLMEINGGIHRHFLSGEEEVQAFNNNEFMRIHNSTLAKVGFLHSIIRKLLSGKFRTAAHGFGIALDRLFESRLAKGIGLFGTIIAIGVSGRQIYLWLIQ